MCSVVCEWEKAMEALSLYTIQFGCVIDLSFIQAFLYSKKSVETGRGITPGMKAVQVHKDCLPVPRIIQFPFVPLWKTIVQFHVIFHASNQEIYRKQWGIFLWKQKEFCSGQNAVLGDLTCGFFCTSGYFRTYFYRE